MNYLPKVRRGKIVLKERKKNLRRREIQKARKLWREYAGNVPADVELRGAALLALSR
jgi:hypothetical protein